MKSLCSVYCVGNAVADVLTRPVNDFAPSGTSQSLDDVALSAGGNCINTAIALARLGIPIKIAAAAGDDAFGEMLRLRIRQEGIDETGLITIAKAKSSVSIVLIESSGERRFLHLRGANAFFTAGHLDWELAKGAKFFHYASAFALPALDADHLAPTLERAHELGCLTSINICWDTQGRWMSVLRPALEHTDFIFPNCDEGRALTGESEPVRIAAKLRELGVKTVIVKLGAKGCYVDSPEGSFTAPGFSVEPLDTTGAGDCFAAGFLAALSIGKTLPEAARYANASGALATLSLGGADAAPSMPQLEAFMNRRADK